MPVDRAAGPPGLMAVKFGGSIVTDRAGICALREERVGGFARALAEHVRTAPGPAPLVLLGGGSFAHPFARHVIGATDPAERASQAARMIEAIDTLRGRFVAACREAGLDATGWSEQALFGVDRSGPFARAGAVAEVAACGGIAVLTGGCIDRGGGDYVLLSSDDLPLLLCDQLGISRFAILTDVEGVMDRSGSGPSDALIEHVHAEEAEAALDYCGENKLGDMTGGMQRKVANCIQLIRRGIACYIGTGRTMEPDALAAIVAGTRRGTYFHIAAPTDVAAQPGEKI
jgi:isopentenyl phosphate kinase